MPIRSRRHFLATSGVAFSTALTGCTDLISGGGGGGSFEPEQRRVVTTSKDGRVRLLLGTEKEYEPRHKIGDVYLDIVHVGELKPPENQDCSYWAAKAQWYNTRDEPVSISDIEYEILDGEGEAVGTVSRLTQVNEYSGVGANHSGPGSWSKLDGDPCATADEIQGFRLTNLTIE